MNKYRVVQSQCQKNSLTKPHSKCNLNGVPKISIPQHMPDMNHSRVSKKTYTFNNKSPIHHKSPPNTLQFDTLRQTLPKKTWRLSKSKTLQHLQFPQNVYNWATSEKLKKTTATHIVHPVYHKIASHTKNLKML